MRIQFLADDIFDAILSTLRVMPRRKKILLLHAGLQWSAQHEGQGRTYAMRSTAMARFG